ncbi:MAG: hypothetical protein GYA46_04360 [candidate division Zixibacteria bacterium]|nr:hypothetical protein [candidate division Zixibacteria bacterium]
MDAMIFRITQRLARKIKVTPAAAVPPHENPFLDWTANLFMVSRWQCILLTNTKTLYSAVLPGKGVPNERALVECGMKALRDNMMLDGIANIFDMAIAPDLESVSLCKAGDRSVLASMNQLIYQVKCDLMEIGHPLPLVNHRLNRTIMSKLKYHFPVEEFSALANRPRI